MAIVSNYKNVLFQRVRAFDVELAEDLYRRMTDISSVEVLNSFFHQLLAQYQESTLILRSTLQNVEFEVWYVNFINNIVPYLIANRLPPCTDRAAGHMYQCQSKSI